MRALVVFIFCFSPVLLFSQNGYNCFNQSNLKSNWEFLGPINKSDELMHQRFGNISSISINPTNSQEIYVGSPTGALMHTTYRGANWESLTDQNDLPIIGVNDILVDYTRKPYHILLATGSENEWYDTPDFGIFKSIDGGKTWYRKKTKEEGIFSDVYYQFINYQNALYCRSRTSIIRSTDRGESWQTILNKNQTIGGHKLKERELRYFFLEPIENKIYFSTKQKYISTGNENGRLYTLDLDDNQIEELTPLLHKTFKSNKKGNGYEAIQILPFENGQLLFAASHIDSRENIFFTYNIKEKKIVDYELPNAANLGVSLYWRDGVHINTKNPNIRYIADIYLYKSTDGGQNYKRLFGYSFGDNGVPHVDIRSMVITKHSQDGLSDEIYIGTDGGLSYSDNGGKSWTNLNGPELQLTQFYGLGSSPFNGTISAGSQDNSIISYIPKEKKWIYRVRGDGYDVAYSNSIPGKAYGQYNNRAMSMSENDIVPFYKGMNLAPQGNSNNRKTIVAHKNGDVFFAGQSLFHLPKGSTKWNEYKTPLSHKALAIAVSETDPNTIYMSGLWGDLIKSSDGGESWKKLNANLIVDGMAMGARIMSICISPYDKNNVWIGFGYMGDYSNICKSTNRIIESTNGGRTWQNASSGLPIFPIHDIIFYKGTYETLFAATDQGVYYRRGSGYKWQRFSQNLPNTLIGELNINYCRGKLTAATYGRGLWETDLPPIQDKNRRIIRNKTAFDAPKGEAIVLTQDIKLRRRGRLRINCPVHIHKGGKISVRRKRHIQFGPNGKIVNNCDEEYLGIVDR